MLLLFTSELHCPELAEHPTSIFIAVERNQNIYNASKQFVILRKYISKINNMVMDMVSISFFSRGWLQVGELLICF